MLLAANGASKSGARVVRLRRTRIVTDVTTKEAKTMAIILTRVSVAAVSSPGRSICITLVKGSFFFLDNSPSRRQRRN